MNLNEAAETMRRYYDPKDQFDGPCGTAPDVLQFAMLSELDPTPITEEWLAANGWEKLIPPKEWRSFFTKEDREIYHRHGRWYFVGYQFPITTLGELRTLLRLAGETQGEKK